MSDPSVRRASSTATSPGTPCGRRRQQRYTWRVSLRRRCAPLQGEGIVETSQPGARAEHLAGGRKRTIGAAHRARARGRAHGARAGGGTLPAASTRAERLAALCAARDSPGAGGRGQALPPRDSVDADPRLAADTSWRAPSALFVLRSSPQAWSEWPPTSGPRGAVESEVPTCCARTRNRQAMLES